MENPSSEFEIQFWGVRGSIPSPGAATVRYGGNTSCIEMRVGGKRLIFDGGTGIRMLGKSLSSLPSAELHLLFTHYHWDHIQGIPFFLPIMQRGNRFHIYGQVPPGETAKKMKQHFFDHVLHLSSPLTLEEIQADLEFIDIVCGQPFNIGEIQLDTRPLNHPNGAMGYRVTWQGRTAVYCTDTEHLGDRLDENVLALAQDADVLIYDAMYTDEEYHDAKTPKAGWGHSTWQEGVKVAQAANVKQLVIFHHEPNHNDEFLDAVGKRVKENFPNTVMAQEGMTLQLSAF